MTTALASLAEVSPVAHWQHHESVSSGTPTSELSNHRLLRSRSFFDLANRKGGLRFTIVATQPAKLVLLCLDLTAAASERAALAARCPARQQSCHSHRQPGLAGW